MRPAGVVFRDHTRFRQRHGDVHPRRRIQHLNPLTDAERIDARRYCGYPAYGGSASGFSSWRFFQVYGLLEYRLSNLADGELAVIRRYLTTLTGLEVAIPGASENLDTDQAAVWSRNPNETRDREQLFDSWRTRLCAFLGIPPGPGLGSNAPNLIV